MEGSANCFVWNTFHVVLCSGFWIQVLQRFQHLDLLPVKVSSLQERANFEKEVARLRARESHLLQQLQQAIMEVPEHSTDFEEISFLAPPPPRRARRILLFILCLLLGGLLFALVHHFKWHKAPFLRCERMLGANKEMRGQKNCLQWHKQEHDSVIAVILLFSLIQMYCWHWRCVADRWLLRIASRSFDNLQAWQETVQDQAGPVLRGARHLHFCWTNFFRMSEFSRKICKSFFHFFLLFFFEIITRSWWGSCFSWTSTSRSWRLKSAGWGQGWGLERRRNLWLVGKSQRWYDLWT